MKKFGYLIDKITFTLVDPRATKADEEHALSSILTEDYGLDGWEVVAIQDYGSFVTRKYHEPEVHHYEYHVTFKREIDAT